MNATVTVIGRRWFEKVNGNTYYSVEVYYNGDLIGCEPYDYGYGSMYSQRAAEIMRQVPGYELPAGQDWEPLWQSTKRNGDKLIDSVTDVQRKKDL